MITYNWNSEKNLLLKKNYEHQQILIVKIENYIVFVPFVENADERLMKEFDLDQEETELLASVEAGEWVSVDSLKDEISVHKEIAKNTLKKDKRVNLRMSSKDLEAIK